MKFQNYNTKTPTNYAPLLNTAQRIQALAQAGLTYCQSDYDCERY